MCVFIDDSRANSSVCFLILHCCHHGLLGGRNGKWNECFVPAVAASSIFLQFALHLSCPCTVTHLFPVAIRNVSVSLSLVFQTSLDTYTQPFPPSTTSCSLLHSADTPLNLQDTSRSSQRWYFSLFSTIATLAIFSWIYCPSISFRYSSSKITSRQWIRNVFLWYVYYIFI